MDELKLIIKNLENRVKINVCKILLLFWHVLFYAWFIWIKWCFEKRK